MESNEGKDFQARQAGSVYNNVHTPRENWSDYHTYRYYQLQERSLYYLYSIA